MSLTRIISDVHLGHPGSLVKSAEQLLPLFAGVENVIMNGDSVEMRSEEEIALSSRRIQALQELGATARSMQFINGNHDPFISPLDFLDLPGGVFVTHGDILFRGTVPWCSKTAASMIKDRTRIREKGLNVSNNRADTVSAHPSVLRGTEDSHPDSLCARNLRCLQEFWPPHRGLRIARFWLETPARAAQLLSEFRPTAKFAIMGHTHMQGIQRHRGGTIINTGSLKTWMGGRIVDIEGNWLIVRSIHRRRGIFAPGKIVQKFRIA